MKNFLILFLFATSNIYATENNPSTKAGETTSTENKKISLVSVEQALLERYTRIENNLKQGGTCKVGFEVSDKKSINELNHILPLLDAQYFIKDRPLKLELPDQYYNPAGKTLIITTREIALNKENPSHYLLFEKSPEGLITYSQLFITLNEGKAICTSQFGVLYKFQS